MNGKIEHVVVLMLENRSFDHMLGFLNHPRPAQFNGLTGLETNPDSLGGQVRVSREATPVLSRDPEHEHAGVWLQLTGKTELNYDAPITNQGFVQSYEKAAASDPGGDAIMRCFSEDKIPILAELAKDYAVCNHYFCSVPGATWPNRLFAHAATSHGTVNNRITNYNNRTVFEELTDRHGTQSWSVYRHDWSVPQVLSFQGVRFKGRVKSIDRLAQDIEDNTLSKYSFIEPHHGIAGRATRGMSNSQHPYNNSENGLDFNAGERLIKHVYEALKRKNEIWQKTLLIITYDEHGGFFDRMTPARTIAPDTERSPDYPDFDFTRLGPRVPAVLVSPWIPKNTVDTTVYDHSSIVRTVLDLFVSTQRNLTFRDQRANSLARNLTLDVARLDESELTVVEPAAETPGFPPADEPFSYDRLDDFQKGLILMVSELERATRDSALNTRLESLSGQAFWDYEFDPANLPEFSTVKEAGEFIDHAVEVLNKPS